MKQREGRKEKERDKRGFRKYANESREKYIKNKLV